MKGVIPHTPAMNDQLKTRMLALLGPAQPLSDTKFAEDDDSVTAADEAPLSEHGSTSNVIPGSLQPESFERSLSVPTPITPHTPPCGVDDSENQQQLENDNIENGSDHGQHPAPPAASETTALVEGSPRPKNPSEKPDQRQNWRGVQRERERQQQVERERIKAQIQHDHAERRRLNELRRQPAIDLTAHDAGNLAESSSRRPTSSEVRIQVRTFEGSTIRSAFGKTATISSQVRPWIDSTTQQSNPYNLKIILAPQPNRTIEAAEEEKSLEDLDLVGSCTLVMVPVKGLVESYGPSGSGMIGSAVSGGYNLLSGSIGAVLGGVQSVLGFGQVSSEVPVQAAPEGRSTSPPTGQVRVRTLADQRIEAQKKDQQFYNGNQLNFESRKDKEDGKED